MAKNKTFEINLQLAEVDHLFQKPEISPFSEDYQVYNKRGSLLTPYVVADTGILETSNGRSFVITIFAYNSEPKTTYERLDQAVEDIALAFWTYISTD